MKLLLKNKWNIENIIGESNDFSLVDSILSFRGIDINNAKQDFITPRLRIVHDPFLFKDMEIACGLINEAIRNNEKIVVFGDYDVDGITSTSLLYLFLKRIGAKAEFLIPDRILDGYGLTEYGVSKIEELDASLLITVDCGITSINEVQLLLEKNIKVIITDHHECKATLPSANAVLNPKREDSVYPFRSLAGVGVAFKLVQALCIRLNLGDIWVSYLDLVALGTIADMVPLIDENRVYVYFGLIEINRSDNIGLRCLINASELKDKEITASTIGYAIAPKINAAGRMGDSKRAVRLLTTADFGECDYLVGELLMDNKRRQDIELEIFETAKSIIEKEVDLASNDIIIVSQKGWNQGVIGIVASRLVELYHRPVIILSGEDDQYKGSGRGTDAVSILDAIEYASDFVHKFGGHKKAAGLVVNECNLECFKTKIMEYSSKQIAGEVQENVVNIDFEIPYSLITLENAKEILKLAPFGEENKQPVFASRKLTVEKIRFLSGGKHTKFTLSCKNRSNTFTLARFDAIAFGFSEKESVFAIGDKVDVVYSMDINEWNGSVLVQLCVRDISHSVSDMNLKLMNIEKLYNNKTEDLFKFIEANEIPLSEVLPQKSDYISIYQFLKTNFGIEQVICDLELLANMISNNYKIAVSIFKLSRIFDIFKEVGLLSVKDYGNFRVRFELLEVKEKTSLTNSKTYRALNKESVL